MVGAVWVARLRRRFRSCLAVGALGALSAANVAALEVDAVLTPADVPVQAQAIYTLRFWQDVAVDNLKLLPPRVRLADVHPLGPPSWREAERDGRRYRVHEQRWAIVPFASGALEVGPGAATGYAVTRQQTFRREAQTLSLSVQAVPSDWQGAWLPATEVRLTTVRSPPTEATAGIAFRQTVRLEVVGVAARQLPEISVSAPSLIVHPLPPALSERPTPDGLVAVREQSFDLVPRTHGQVTVPPIRLVWWKNGAGGGPRIAELPGVAVRVRPRDVTPGSSVPVTPMNPIVPSHPQPGDATAESASTVATPGSVDAHRAPWVLSVVGGAFVAICAVAVVWWWRRRSWHQLRRACRDNDPQAARAALLQWAGRRLAQSPRGLEELAARSHHGPFLLAVTQLARVLYGPPSQSWRGEDLLRACKTEVFPAAARRGRLSYFAAGRLGRLLRTR